MNRLINKPITCALVFILLLVFSEMLFAQQLLDCTQCHQTEHDLWLSSRHADTQNDVADELAEEWAGLPPDSVILGQGAENCIACHGARAVTLFGGMTEVEALNHFFSTTNGVFTDSTHALDPANWPHVACETCHDIPLDHPLTLPTLSIFNSTTAQYDSIGNASVLCGQCHGTLRFAETDHRRYDAWKMSNHGHGGQEDVAGELAEEWAGSTPDEVINGPEAENCIACHAPTSVLINGGITEAQALGNFFTTSGGVFTGSTVPADTIHWPDVSCTACHNPLHPDTLSYFNSTTKDYQEFGSSQELCGQCHGNLRFADTDHLSYNIASGSGGIGVPDTLTMPGIQCVDCHMHVGDEDDTNSLMYGGHAWSVFIEEPDGSTTASCTSCHLSISANLSEIIVENWQAEFANLDSIAQIKVAAADSFLTGSTDTLMLQYLDEAQHNLEYAESDESGGVHNHIYLMSLLNDAVAKSELIMTGISDLPVNLVKQFELFQNYPNPFNPSTTIQFNLKESSNITLAVYNTLGQLVDVLQKGKFPPGSYKYQWDAKDHNGNLVPAGIYFCKLSTDNGFAKTRKMILIK